LGEKKPTDRVLGYSAESPPLLVVRAIPSAPPLFTNVVVMALRKTHGSLFLFPH
jgi:hypothetical protein